MQLELHSHEQLDRAWRRLAKRDAKQAQADADHVPAPQQPEALFLPQMLDEFLQVSLQASRLAIQVHAVHVVLSCLQLLTVA